MHLFGDDSWSARDGRRDVSPHEIPKDVKARPWVDSSLAKRGGERAHSLVHIYGDEEAWYLI